VSADSERLALSHVFVEARIDERLG